MSNEELLKAEKTIKIASDELAHLCNEKWAGRDGWHWEIPANEERDTDLRIGAAIGLAKDLLAEVQRLRRMRPDWRDATKEKPTLPRYVVGVDDKCEIDLYMWHEWKGVWCDSRGGFLPKNFHNVLIWMHIPIYEHLIPPFAAPTGGEAAV